jgi:hypothetical protein
MREVTGLTIKINNAKMATIRLPCADPHRCRGVHGAQSARPCAQRHAIACWGNPLLKMGDIVDKGKPLHNARRQEEYEKRHLTS